MLSDHERKVEEGKIIVLNNRYSLIIQNGCIDCTTQDE